MKKKPSVLGVILARSGSKRLPGKNYADLGGKPLVEWSIESGVKSNRITDLIVSSDCPVIQEIAKREGVEVLNRPASLASDDATSIDSLVHVVNSCLTRNAEYEYIILLQPTSPFRTGEDIDDAFDQMLAAGSKRAVSVCECEHSPLWCSTRDVPTGFFGDFILDSAITGRSQDLPTYYRLNGAIYIAPVVPFLESRSLFDKSTYAYIMPRLISADIDTLDDLDYARFLVDTGRV